MPLVARYADEWNVPIGVDARRRQAAARRHPRRLRAASAARRACAQVSVFLPLANITDVPLAGPATRLGARLLVDERAAVSVLAGSADEIKEKIRSYLDVGATSVIITTRPSINHELMKRFASEIMPAFRPAS